MNRKETIVLIRIEQELKDFRKETERHFFRLNGKVTKNEQFIYKLKGVGKTLSFLFGGSIVWIVVELFRGM